MNLTGRIVEAFSYNTMFLIMGFLHPLAFLLCRWLVGSNPGGAPRHVDAAAAANG